MPKCSKYHAEWQILVPNCCKYKANGTKKESNKKKQNLSQKKKKTIILNPFSCPILPYYSNNLNYETPCNQY